MHHQNAPHPLTTPTDDDTGMGDRALGALYGLALGDALGMPTQVMSRAAIASRFGGSSRSPGCSAVSTRTITSPGSTIGSSPYSSTATSRTPPRRSLPASSFSSRCTRSFVAWSMGRLR